MIEFVVKSDSDRGAVHCPRVRCDECGLTIDDANWGNVYYDPNRADGGAPAIFLHKPCSRSFEERRKDVFWSWEEMSVWFVQLASNARLDRKRSEARARRLESL